MENPNLTPPFGDDQEPGARLRNRYFQFQFERLFLLPPFIWVMSLVTHDRTILVAAYLLWPLVYVIWSGAILWGFVGDRPRRDVWRAVAWLVHGGASVGLAALAFALMAPMRVAEVEVFPALFVVGIWLALLARAPDPMLPGRRRWLVSSAAATSAIWALLFAAAATAIHARTINPTIDAAALFLFVTMAALIALLGAALAYSAWRGFPVSVTAASPSID